MTTTTLTARGTATDDGIAPETAYDRLGVELVDVGHAKLAYRRTGRGPDVVFVHGWPLHAATFRDLLPLLAPHFTCHLFDLPGTGDSEWSDPRTISIPKHADAIETAVDRIGLDRYAMIAHDSGAAIARMVAARHGDRVMGLVLGNTEVPGYEPWMLKMYVFLGKIPGVRSLLTLPLRSRAYRHSTFGFGACFGDRNLIDGEFHRRFVQPLFDSRRALEGQLGLLGTFDFADVENLGDVHEKLRAPVLLVWGEKDPWFPLREARRTLPTLPAGSKLEVIEGAKLFVHEERPEEFARHALEFLRVAQ